MLSILCISLILSFDAGNSAAVTSVDLFYPRFAALASAAHAFTQHGDIIYWPAHSCRLRSRDTTQGSLVAILLKYVVCYRSPTALILLDTSSIVRCVAPLTTTTGHQSNSLTNDENSGRAGTACKEKPREGKQKKT